MRRDRFALTGLTRRALALEAPRPAMKTAR
jgi:hypothetical protein